ncbi:MAG: type II secretion system protein [Acidobacteriota bacterium]|nr:type II secretion system protein [Acidobacteriota bacterium]
MFNFKKAKGFTLIELLIVVAIIGILAALLIPNALTAMQKARQKSCMKEIMTISTGAMDYITDNSTWLLVEQSGDLSLGNQFITNLSPFYVRSIPINDAWNNPYQVYVGEDASAGMLTNVDPDQVGEEDFVIFSGGRGGIGTGDYTITSYDPLDPEASLYTVRTMADFNNHLAAWSGNWIVAPRTTAESQQQ